MRIWLKEARLNKYLSQEALAHAIGVSTSAIRFWEAGRNEPSLKHQGLLSQTLGVDIRAKLKDERIPEQHAIVA